MKQKGIRNKKNRIDEKRRIRRKILSKGLREKFSGTDIFLYSSFFKEDIKRYNTKSRKLEKNGARIRNGNGEKREMETREREDGKDGILIDY